MVVLLIIFVEYNIYIIHKTFSSCNHSLCHGTVCY